MPFSEIPHKIIQTGKHVRLPLRDRAMVANIRLLNPGYEYLYFDDDAVRSFIDREFPQYRPVFDSFHFNIQRYDFFRYLAVFRFGGYYFDLDIILASPLSVIEEKGCVFPFEGLTYSRLLRDKYSIDWQIGNYAFGAAPGHPFLKRVIDNCLRAQEDPRWVKPMMKGAPALSKDEFYVLNSTGPGVLTRTLAESRDLADMITVLFPEDVCDLETWNRFGDIGFHMMDGSWRMKKSVLSRRLAMYLEARSMRSLVKESKKQGKTRRLPSGSKEDRATGR